LTTAQDEFLVNYKRGAIDFIKHLIKNAPFRVQRIRVDNRYGKKFIAFCDLIGIGVIENEPYNPKQNDKIERFHKTLKREFFRKYCSFRDSIEVMQYKYSLWQNHYNANRKHSGYGMNKMAPRLKIMSALFNSLNVTNYPQKITLAL